MEWYYWAMAGLGVVTFLTSLIGTAVGLTWRLSVVAREIREEADEKIKAVDTRCDLLADVLRREFGETAKAALQKIHELEIWSRDEFVRKQSFVIVNQETRQAIQDQGDRIEKRLDRMENKLDTLNGHS